MNKKIVSILFAFVLCFCMVLPAFAVTDSTEINGFADEYSRVIDYAGVIPQQEEDKNSLTKLQTGKRWIS